MKAIKTQDTFVIITVSNNMNFFRFSVSGKILLDIFYDDCLRRLVGRSIVSKRIYNSGNIYQEKTCYMRVIISRLG